MMKTTDECVDCRSLGLHCLGDSCPRINVKRYYCDVCGEEHDRDELRQVGNEHICQECYTESAAQEAAFVWFELERPEEE